MTTKISGAISKEPAEALLPDLDALLDWVGEIPTYGKRHNKETIDYYNVPMAFDIETTSAYTRDERGKLRKTGTMYLWAFAIAGMVIQGRTWEEFVTMCERLQDRLGLCHEKRAIVYVRNLEFEFQFMRKWFVWENVFAINQRHPVYAVCDLGIEFRCSYILSGESLATTGKKLRKYTVRKLEGDLDYTLPRHCQTPLTAQEIAYSINDVRVDCAYIKEKMEDVGDQITRLQLTKTGYVRKYVRDACMYAGSHKRKTWKALAYRDKMKRLKLEPLEEYPLLKRAFQGGFTHTSARFSGTVQRGVDSWDLTSSYPASMIAYKYPMSSGEKIRIKGAEDFRRMIAKYCCVFDVEFVNICIKPEAPDCPISRSKCWKISGEVENNGRVARAKMLQTTITDVDFQIYEQYYTWDQMRVGTFYRYRRGYLPTEIVDALLTLYEKKTTLKNVPGREQEYQQAKENINSAYGMIVTDICREQNVYNGTEWEETKAPDLVEEIEKYNESPRRFLFYPWGVYVTAYSRLRLFRAIWACGERRYYYSDTDSCKIVNGADMRTFFEAENAAITERIERALKWHRLDPARARPKTIKGVEKPLGVWDYEGQYSRFKALRAKAYMTETDGEISLTVSGVNKKTAVPYLVKKYADPFQAFDDALEIPAGAAGKLTHTYIDGAQDGMLRDYLGNVSPYHERSAIHMEQAAYNMELSLQYLDYLRGYREVRIKE